MHIDLIEVTLPNNPSNGLKWVNVSKDDFELINIVQNSEYNPMQPSNIEIENTYVFRPKRDGELCLRLEYRRPWEKDAPPLKVHEEIVMVEK